MARPKLWVPLNHPGIRRDYERRITDNAIRNGSHNIIKDRLDGEHVYIDLESTHGERQTWDKAAVIARVLLGPPVWRCKVCGKPPDVGIKILYLNGHVGDFSEGNIGYRLNLIEAGAHVRRCWERVVCEYPWPHQNHFARPPIGWAA